MTIGDLFQRLFQGFVNTELTTISTIILLILFFGSFYLIGKKYKDWLDDWVENFKNPFIKFVVWVFFSLGGAVLLILLFLGIVYSL